MDAEDADADARDEASQRSRSRAPRRMASDGAMRGHLRGHDEAVIEATMPTERSMPPVSIVSVWHAARMASGMAKRMVERRPSAG